MSSGTTGDVEDILDPGGFLHKDTTAFELAKEQMARMQALELPDIQKMQLHLEDLIQQGTITPEEAKAYMQQNSQMAGVTTDPKLKQAQMDALSSLQDIGQSGGVTLGDKANLSNIATDEATKQRGSREAILQNAQARGMGGSGMELMAQLQNQQDSATRQNARDLDVAGQGQARALAALQAAGTMGGQMQGTEFNQKAEQAKAQDAINQFNTANQQAVGNANTQASNVAQAQNLAEKQRVADTNVAGHNAAQQYNKSLEQTQFDNAYKKAGGVGQASQVAGDQWNKAVDAQTKKQGQAMQAAGKAFSDERVKKDVKDFDASKFLDDLTSVKYNYKNKDMGEGKQVGVMAQDLEKEVPQMVEDTAHGKVVDYSPAKAGGPIFAALADIHKRLKHIEGRK